MLLSRHALALESVSTNHWSTSPKTMAISQREILNVLIGSMFLPTLRMGKRVPIKELAPHTPDMQGREGSPTCPSSNQEKFHHNINIIWD